MQGRLLGWREALTLFCLQQDALEGKGLSKVRNQPSLEAFNCLPAIEGCNSQAETLLSPIGRLSEKAHCPASHLRAAVFDLPFSSSFAAQSICNYLHGDIMSSAQAWCQLGDFISYSSESCPLHIIFSSIRVKVMLMHVEHMISKCMSAHAEKACLSRRQPWRFTGASTTGPMWTT